MLEELYLENYVLFEAASLQFTPGLNIISGETGSGKSLIADALALALGERASPQVIRSGNAAANITAVFALPEKLRPAFVAGGGVLPDGEGKIVFTRSIQKNGRSRLTVAGRPVSATEARSLGNRLLDMATQNEHSRLLDPAYQREVLDRFGQTTKAAADFAAAFARAVALQERLRAGEAERERARQRLSQVRRNLDELAKLAYDPQADLDLENRIQALANATEIRVLTERGISLLYENEDSVQDTASQLLAETRSLSIGSASLQEATNALEGLAAGIEEAVRCYREAADAVDCPPGQVDELIQRAEALKEIARRLGGKVAELPELAAALRAEAEELSGWETGVEAGRRELAARLGELAESGLALRRKRSRTARRLARAAEKELASLGMPAARFSVDILAAWEVGEDAGSLIERASAGGLEEIVFKIAPNPGEVATALADTASGGETSRAMLAIKSALASAHRPPVLFFDEIDAGVGGRLGDVVAGKLRDLARSRQVIAITHLPQIAAQAHTHLRVTKSVSGGRTRATVKCLAGEERVEEVAQMIRGKARSQITRTQAEEMLGPPPRDR